MGSVLRGLEVTEAGEEDAEGGMRELNAPAGGARVSRKQGPGSGRPAVGRPRLPAGDRRDAVPGPDLEKRRAGRSRPAPLRGWSLGRVHFLHPPNLGVGLRKGEGSQHDLILSPQGHCKVSIDPILRMRQLRLREVRLAAPGPTANQCRGGIRSEDTLSSTLSPPIPLTGG